MNKKRKKTKKRVEFSKIVLASVLLTYFVGLIYGIVVISIMLRMGNLTYIATSLCGLLSYIGAPVAVAIGFYSNKAKAENIEKIKLGDSSGTTPEPIVIDDDTDNMGFDDGKEGI